MLISFSNLVMASQLIVTVADNVPNYKIERNAKSSTSLHSTQMPVNRCAHDEQAAKDR
jgi:hypothetical protein